MAEGQHLCARAVIGDGSRIRDARMRGDGMIRPHRASFAGSLIADGKDSSQGFEHRRFRPGLQRQAEHIEACFLGECAQTHDRS